MSTTAPPSTTASSTTPFTAVSSTTNPLASPLNFTSSVQLNWQLEPACEAWLPQVHAAEVASYVADECASLERFHTLLSESGAYFKCAIMKGSGNFNHQSVGDGVTVLGMVIGTLSSHSKLDHDTMFSHDPNGHYLGIHNVCVLPLLQRQGIGRLMFMEYLRQIREEQKHLKGILLMCKEQYRQFYASCGFTYVGKSTVEWGKDAWFDYRMDLEPTAADPSA